MTRNKRAKNPLLGIIILGGILFFFILLQYTTYKRAYVQQEKLTQVQGIITNVQKIKFGRGNLSYAYALTIKDIPISFAIQDNDIEAYSFIQSNKVTGRQVNLLYNQSDFNADENLTFHVYEVNINGRNILSLNKTTRFYKYVFYISFIVPIFFITMIAYKRRTKHRLISYSVFNSFSKGNQ